jgi:hypothetical protein
MGRLNREQKKFDKPKGEGPQTLVELTSRAMSSSRKGLRNAREAISGPSDEAETLNETTASTPPPSPQTPAPAPQASATAPQVLTPAPQASVTPPEALPQAAAPPPEKSSPSRAQRMKNAAYSAGSAVGGFARKSYNCMWSLFRKCSSQAQSAE